MTLAQYFNSQFTFAQTMDFFIRILVASACGAVIGLERTKRFKEAGIRTHVMVACASALFMILSKYAFVDLTNPDGTFFNGTKGADTSRIAAGIVSGISFLGAGIIFRNGSTVKGLTTAAGIWATSGIGMAIGSGFFWLGIFVTVIITIFQFVMHKYTVGADSYTTNNLKFTVAETEALSFRRTIITKIEELEGQIIDCTISHLDNGLTRYDITVKIRRGITMDELVKFMQEHPEIVAGANTSV